MWSSSLQLYIHEFTDKSLRKHRQFTWPKYFNVYSKGTSSGLENVEKSRGCFSSYFFKVIIVNSEFQTYIIWFCEPLNYMYVYKNMHIHVWHTYKLSTYQVEIYIDRHTHLLHPSGIG